MLLSCRSRFGLDDVAGHLSRGPSQLLVIGDLKTVISDLTTVISDL